MVVQWVVLLHLWLEGSGLILSLGHCLPSYLVAFPKVLQFSVISPKQHGSELADHVCTVTTMTATYINSNTVCQKKKKEAVPGFLRHQHECCD